MNELLNELENTKTNKVVMCGRTYTTMGRRENDDIALYDISNPEAVEEIARITLADKKIWAVDAAFIRNLCEAFNKWGANRLD